MLATQIKTKGFDYDEIDDMVHPSNLHTCTHPCAQPTSLVADESGQQFTIETGATQPSLCIVSATGRLRHHKGCWYHGGHRRSNSYGLLQHRERVTEYECCVNVGGQ